MVVAACARRSQPAVAQIEVGDGGVASEQLAQPRDALGRKAPGAPVVDAKELVAREDEALERVVAL